MEATPILGKGAFSIYLSPSLQKMVAQSAELEIQVAKLAHAWGITHEQAMDRALAYCRTSLQPTLVAIWDCFEPESRAAAFMRGQHE